MTGQAPNPRPENTALTDAFIAEHITGSSPEDFYSGVIQLVGDEGGPALITQIIAADLEGGISILRAIGDRIDDTESEVSIRTGINTLPSTVADGLLFSLTTPYIYTLAGTEETYKPVAQIIGEFSERIGDPAWKAGNFSTLAHSIANRARLVPSDDREQFLEAATFADYYLTKALLAADEADTTTSSKTFRPAVERRASGMAWAAEIAAELNANPLMEDYPEVFATSQRRFETQYDKIVKIIGEFDPQEHPNAYIDAQVSLIDKLLESANALYADPKLEETIGHHVFNGWQAHSSSLLQELREGSTLGLPLRDTMRSMVEVAKKLSQKVGFSHFKNVEKYEGTVIDGKMFEFVTAVMDQALEAHQKDKPIGDLLDGVPKSVGEIASNIMKNIRPIGLQIQRSAYQLAQLDEVGKLEIDTSTREVINQILQSTENATDIKEFTEIVNNAFAAVSSPPPTGQNILRKDVDARTRFEQQIAIADVCIEHLSMNELEFDDAADQDAWLSNGLLTVAAERVGSGDASLAAVVLPRLKHLSRSMADISLIEAIERKVQAVLDEQTTSTQVEVVEPEVQIPTSTKRAAQLLLSALQNQK